MNYSELAPSANPVFYRTYSRKIKGKREGFAESMKRFHQGLVEIGKLNQNESDLLDEQIQNLACLPSGRWMWVGGTDWVKKPQNYSGAYNCSSTNVDSWEAFGYIMDLAMQGCGTGAVLEPHFIRKLPIIRNKLNITIGRFPGSFPQKEKGDEDTTLVPSYTYDDFFLFVGDSRKGWVDAYIQLLRLSSDSPLRNNEVNLRVDLSSVRPSGTPLKGFGGVANPSKLPELFTKCADILNNAIGRQLTSVECALLINEAALVVVAGNIRRSANIQQGGKDDHLFANAKDNLWQQDEHGNWSIDPKRDALRMANLTRVFHSKPTLEECIESVRKQYYSGEGAIQYANEAIIRGSADLLPFDSDRLELRYQLDNGRGDNWFATCHPNMSKKEVVHRLQRYGLNPCGEILLNNNHCNLAEVHLNNIDPYDFMAQEEAFKSGALSVAALLHHKFPVERYQYSREVDPIVGVSFTGLFDFFVNLFGVKRLQWWEAGRPDYYRLDIETSVGEVTQNAAVFYKEKEQEYLTYWKSLVNNTVWEYCDRHGLKRPNRCTTVQPAGTKSLLTNASPGWHPPKSQRFIRRITFSKNDPVALACIDYGFSVIPSQSDRDEHGNLLNNPFDERCTEWLVEIPTQVPWADLEGADKIDIGKFSALAQFDFYIQVQRHYTTHNTSATIEFTQQEIEPLGTRIYEAIQNDEGYISAALLARFESHQTFPRLPFEPISKSVYDELQREVIARRKSNDFLSLLNKYDHQLSDASDIGPAGCDSDKCLMPLKSK